MRASASARGDLTPYHKVRGFLEMLIKRSLSKKRRFGVLSSHEDDKPTLCYLDVYLQMLMYITSHSNRLLFYHLNTFMIVKEKLKIKVIGSSFKKFRFL